MANTIRLKRGTTTPSAGSLVTGELAVNTSTGAVFTKTDGGSVVALNSASPSLTGTPTAPTASTSTNSTQIATTAYVKSNLSSYVSTTYLTSTLSAYTQTASLNNDLIATDVVTELYDLSVQGTHLNAVVKIDTESATSHTVTFPDEANYGFPIGGQVVFVQMDSYSAVFVADSGVTLLSRGSRTTMNGQYSVATAIKIASNTWVLSGDLV